MFVDFDKAFDCMEYNVLAYGLPEETVTAIIMMHYRNMKVKVHSLDSNTNFFNIVAEILQGDYISTIFDYNLPRLCILNIDRSKKMMALHKKKEKRKGKKQTSSCRNYYGHRLCR